MGTVTGALAPNLRVAVGDIVIDAGRYGTVALVSGDMPGYLAVDFDGVLLIRHRDQLLFCHIRTAGEFADRLADENGWSLGRGRVVVRQFLTTAGFPLDAWLSEAHWEYLARQHFAADVHRATFRSLVGA